MTRIVPSQVVETIRRLFTGPSGGFGTTAPSLERIYQTQGIVHLLRQLPSELLALDAQDFADLTVATGAIELAISRWITDASQRMSLPPVSGKDVIVTIRDILAKCPDEFPSAGTAELSFISDQQIRNGLRQDIGAANTALQNAEWKAATILGGAAVEALLHWKITELQTQGTDIRAAGQNAVKSGKLKKAPGNDLDRWDLIDFIAVA